LVESEGWSLVATPEAGATPQMIGCCDLVVVDLALGQALVRWLAQHARGRLAGLCGSSDIAQHDVADCCRAFVYHPRWWTEPRSHPPRTVADLPWWNQDAWLCTPAQATDRIKPLNRGPSAEVDP